MSWLQRVSIESRSIFQHIAALLRKSIRRKIVIGRWHIDSEEANDPRRFQHGGGQMYRLARYSWQSQSKTPVNDWTVYVQRRTPRHFKVDENLSKSKVYYREKTHRETLSQLKLPGRKSHWTIRVCSRRPLRASWLDFKIWKISLPIWTKPFPY